MQPKIAGQELFLKLGKAAVFVTHDLREAVKLGSRIVMLAGGRVEAVVPAEADGDCGAGDVELLPILRNTYVGIRSVDPVVCEAAVAMVTTIGTATIPAALLALAADWWLGWIEERFSPE